MFLILSLAVLSYYNPDAGAYILGLYTLKWIGQLTVLKLKGGLN